MCNMNVNESPDEEDIEKERKCLPLLWMQLASGAFRPIETQLSAETVRAVPLRARHRPHETVANPSDSIHLAAQIDPIVDRICKAKG